MKQVLKTTIYKIAPKDTTIAFLFDKRAPLILVALLFSASSLLASDVTDIDGIIGAVEGSMKDVVIKVLTAIWGILAIVLLSAVCWQAYQKRISIEEVVVKALWISIIGFIPIIAPFLVNLGASVGQ